MVLTEGSHRNDMNIERIGGCGIKSELLLLLLIYLRISMKRFRLFGQLKLKYQPL